jgi:hypothetical protein
VVSVLACYGEGSGIDPRGRLPFSATTEVVQGGHRHRHRHLHGGLTRRRIGGPQTSAEAIARIYSQKQLLSAVVHTQGVLLRHAPQADHVFNVRYVDHVVERNLRSSGNQQPKHSTKCTCAQMYMCCTTTAKDRRLTGGPQASRGRNIYSVYPLPKPDVSQMSPGHLTGVTQASRGRNIYS